MGNTSNKTQESDEEYSVEDDDDDNHLQQISKGNVIIQQVKNKQSIRTYEQTYQLNLNILNKHIADSTLTTQILESLAKDAGIRIIDNIPVELSAKYYYISPTLRTTYLRVKESFKYILPEAMSDEFVIKWYKQLYIKYSKCNLKYYRPWEIYHLIVKNIMKNIVYFPDMVFTELFVNYVFDVINKVEYHLIIIINGENYVKNKYTIQQSTLNFKKIFVSKIPDSMMNKMLVKCIVIEDTRLRSLIKPQLLALYDS
jgi:hypothetical protein